MKFHKNMENSALIALDLLYFHMNMIGPAYHCGYNVNKRKHEIGKIQRKK